MLHGGMAYHFLVLTCLGCESHVSLFFCVVHVGAVGKGICLLEELFDKVLSRA